MLAVIPRVPTEAIVPEVVPKDVPSPFVTESVDGLSIRKVELGLDSVFTETRPVEPAA
jgi:hypothetical protein